MGSAEALSLELLRDPGGAERLADVDPFALDGQEARVAFWLNVYNARLRAELADRPRSGSLLRQRSLFRTCGWQVGAYDYTLDQIEHGLLRRNARAPFALRPALGRNDPRRAAAPPRLDARVHFALNCGARSCPVVRPYAAADVDAALDAATAAYLQSESQIEGDAVTLPGLCRLYRRDLGGDDGLRALARRHLGAQPEGRLRFTRFDWTLVRPSAD